MGRQFTESFDMEVLTGRFDLIISASIVSDSLGGGDFALNCAGEIEKTLPSGSDEKFFGFYVKPTNPTVPSQPIMLWKKTATRLGRISFNASRQIQAVVGDGGGEVIVATGTTVWANNDAHHIQLRVKIHDTTGVIQVLVDGVLELDFVGDTKPGADTTIDGFRMNIGDAKYASMIVNDTSGTKNKGFPGTRRMRGRKPDEDGFYNEFDRSPASPTTAFDKLDESGAPNITDFVSTDVNLEAQSLRFPSHGLIRAEVKAVTYLYHMQKITSGAVVHGTRKISTASNIFDAAATQLSTSFRTEEFRYDENPHTALPWTLDEAQEDQFESIIQSNV